MLLLSPIVCLQAVNIVPSEHLKWETNNVTTVILKSLQLLDHLTSQRVPSCQYQHPRTSWPFANLLLKEQEDRNNRIFGPHLENQFPDLKFYSNRHSKVAGNIGDAGGRLVQFLFPDDVCMMFVDKNWNHNLFTILTSANSIKWSETSTRATR